ncbi:MAG: Fic family protein, partial [Streptosporangiaceae bacterium]
RRSYQASLPQAHRDDYPAHAELIARAINHTHNRINVPNLAGPANLVPLAALADEQFTLPALRQAAQRGRLDAVQSADGVWRSSRQAVAAYRASRHQRRGNIALSQ